METEWRTKACFWEK